MRIHDRYILLGFLRNLAIGLIAFTVIYVTVDVNDRIDKYIDNKAGMGELALYYGYKIPWILVLIMPVSVLLATIFTLGRLSRLNELTAFISSGTSLVRVAAPIIIAAIVLSFVIMAFGEYVLPETNQRSETIKRVKLEKRSKQEDSRFKNNLHYQGEGGRVYSAERYDKRLKTFLNLAIHEYRLSTLARRIDARRAVWDGSRWVLSDGAIRMFGAGGAETIETFAQLPLPDLPERPEDFAKDEIAPEDMNSRQLRGYIDKLARAGGSVDSYLVDLYFKFSFPFTNLIFAILGTALSSAKRKPSMATGFGLTLLISFTYYAVLRIGQALGHSGVIEPLLGAWMGNVLFVGIGGLLLYRANK